MSDRYAGEGECMGTMDLNSHEADRWLALIKEKPDLARFSASVVSNPEIIAVLLEIIRQDKGSTKFYCDKVIRQFSETHPSLVYPYFQSIAGLIDSNNNYIKWGALQTIAKLIAVDTERQFDSIYEQYFDQIQSPSMITAATVVGNSWKVIMARPDKEDDITSRLMRVTENTYYGKGEPSPECRDILIGHVITCFGNYFAVSGNKSKILAFAEEQQANHRRSTAAKAAAFVKKYKSASR